MTATNHTTNFGLSQWLGTDHPSFLTDVNSDNTKIDQALKELDEKITQSAGISQDTADGRYVQKTSQAPDVTGLTADQIDRLYVDSDNIIRLKPAD